MKALRILGLIIGLAIPTVALADATGDFHSSCCGSDCCPMCDHCPFR